MPAAPSQERTQDTDARPHLPHDLILTHGIVHDRRVDEHMALIVTFDLATEMFEQFDEHPHIGEIRDPDQ